MKKVILCAMQKESSYIENHDIILSGIGSLSACTSVIENREDLLDADEITVFGTLGAYDETPVGSLVIPDKIFNGNSGFNDKECFKLKKWSENCNENIPEAILLNQDHIRREYDNAGFNVVSKPIVSCDTWHKADSCFADTMKKNYDIMGEEMESFGYLFSLEKLGLLYKTMVIRIVSNNKNEEYNPDKISRIVKRVSEYISKE